MLGGRQIKGVPKPCTQTCTSKAFGRAQRRCSYSFDFGGLRHFEHLVPWRSKAGCARDKQTNAPKPVPENGMVFLEKLVGNDSFHPILTSDLFVNVLKLRFGIRITLRFMLIGDKCIHTREYT